MTDTLIAYACSAEGSWFHLGELPPDALTGAENAALLVARATYPEVLVCRGPVEVARFVQPRPPRTPAEPPRPLAEEVTP